jgi:preprotein translocase subunit SecD
MKSINLILGLITFTLTAGEPLKSATFEVRAVLDSASADSEQLTCVHQGTATRQTYEEKLIVQKKPLIDGADIKSATFQKDPLNSAPEVEVTFTARGAKRFAEVTRDHVGHRLAIIVDGKVCSAPMVQTEIAGGKAVITGSFSEEEATQLAARLSKGATK